MTNIYALERSTVPLRVELVYTEAESPGHVNVGPCLVLRQGSASVELGEEDTEMLGHLLSTAAFAKHRVEDLIVGRQSRV